MPSKEVGLTSQWSGYKEGRSCSSWELILMLLTQLQVRVNEADPRQCFGPGMATLP